MAKTHQRIRKHDMKQDSFVTLAFRAQEYIQNNQKPFIIGLAAIVLATLGIWFFGSASRRAELNAEQTLTEASVRVQQNDMQGAAAVYRRVVDDYGGTAGAREALFYLGNLHFVQRQWTEAAEAYREYIDRHRGWDAGRTAAAWAGVGDSYQAQGAHGDALDAYERALEIETATYLADEILLAAAHSALELEDTEQAAAYADRLFEASGGSSPIMVRMRELLARHGIRYTRGS
jgi:tetratricopeptide (TPR) repeat protein